MLIMGAGSILLSLLSIGKKPNKRKKDRIIRNGKTVFPAMSQEQKLILSKIQLGRKASDAARKKMSESHKMNPRVGYVVLEATKIKLRNSINAYYAKDPTNRMKCVPIISEDGRRRISLANTGNKYHLGMKDTQETKDNISKSKIGRPNGVTYTKELRKKLSLIRIDVCKNPKYRKKMAYRKQYFISKPEAEFALILDQIGIEYERQYPVTEILHAYPADFYLRTWNLIIEIDGLYWHNFPSGNEIDHIRNIELKDAGYHILRFWENEVEDIDKIKFEIETFIKNIDCAFQMSSQKERLIYGK